jgi:hypothetical protein
MSCYLMVMETAVGFSSYGMRNVIVKASSLSAYTEFTQHRITETL